MKHCKYCNHIELSKQEMIIYLFLPASAVDIAKILRKPRKTIFEVLRKLEKNCFVERCVNTRPIVFDKLKKCTSCDNFKFMSAFNTWSCNKSKGIYFYCNDYKNSRDN